jgi:hypothetical protein
MSAQWGNTITMPRDITTPGTMLVDDMPCPTHQIVDTGESYVLRTGQQFWGRMLELLSSRLRTRLQHTDLNLVVASTLAHTCVSSFWLYCADSNGDGERGRNRTYNLLIKSYVSRCGCSIDNWSHHNNLTIKRPAWTVFKSVGKVGEIERHLVAKDTKRTQRDQGTCQSEKTALGL